MNKIIEEWKDIEGYEKLYQISNWGRVKSLERYKNGKGSSKVFVKEKILKPLIDKNSYLFVILCKNGEHKNYKVHRLVAMAFIPNHENKKVVDHINTNRTDNRVENLRWVTQKENSNNTISKINYSKAKKGNKNPMYGKKGKLNPLSKAVLQFDRDMNFIRQWNSATEVKRELGFNQDSISKCCSGKLKTVGGYLWRFAS